MVTYEKLFNILDERNISHIQLVRDAGFSANIMTRIRRGEYVSLESVEKICKALDCKLEEIIEFV